MNYFKWNERIAKYFFNSSNAGKEIYLYLTKDDIIRMGSSDTLRGEHVWNDFICSIRDRKVEGGQNLLIEAMEIYSNWQHSPHKAEIMPSFLAYLVLFILPLTSEFDDLFRANNYYGRLNIFLRSNSFLTPEIGTNNFQLLDPLWSSLAAWSNDLKNGELGIFTLRQFGNPKWIYVGKPLSQCLVPPHIMRMLPEFFSRCGLIPGFIYSNSEFRRILLEYGSQNLGLKPNVIQLIKHSNAHELGNSIIEIVAQEYKKWTGETHKRDLSVSTLFDSITHSHTIFAIYLQIKLNLMQEKIDFSYRTYYVNEYPEDLQFGEFENLYETNGWSRTLNIPFRSDYFELRDDYNKCIAKSPKQNVYIFINASNFRLSGAYCLQTKLLSKTEQMFLLCDQSIKQSIIDWGNTFSLEDFQELHFDGLPNGFSLFRIKNPRESHPTIPLLTIYQNKKIELANGIKVRHRTYLKEHLPEVEIINADGNEEVFLQYRNDVHKVYLEKCNQVSNRWILPENIKLETDFFIKIKDIEVEGYNVAYAVVSSLNTAIKIRNDELPKRDKFGRNLLNDSEQFCLGSNLINPNLQSDAYQSPWANLFRPRDPNNDRERLIPNYEEHPGNSLASFLSLKQILTTEDFYDAFEFFYSKEKFGENQSLNLTKIKKASLNFYDYLGILDYDYKTKKIVLNRPQLILIPSIKGRRALLIGGRDHSLINKIVHAAPRNGLVFEISNQFESNQRLLLPDRILITGFGSNRDVENNLDRFAKDLEIDYARGYYPQLALMLYSADLEEYRSELSTQPDEDNRDFDWVRKEFNTRTLLYEKVVGDFNKTFSLVEYKFNEYTYKTKLWIENISYIVDKNWGTFLALDEGNITSQYILYDLNGSSLGIPTKLPLPRILAESVLLLNGFAPKLKEIDGMYYRIYENVPEIFARNLFQKLKQIPIRRELT